MAENAVEARAHNAALLAALERQAQVVRRQRVISVRCYLYFLTPPSLFLQMDRVNAQLAVDAEARRSGRTTAARRIPLSELRAVELW